MGNLETAKLALRIAKEINREANQSPKEVNSKPAKTNSPINRQDIHIALENISPNLANSYAQVKQDIQDSDRLSWAGTAHEIREILANLLRILAPDKDVKSQSWYRQEGDSLKPTRKQRVRYILHSRGANSIQREVVERVDILDEMVAGLINSAYGRASDAAHTFKTKKEVIKLLGYFEAFAHDLLDL
jgi:hypothetical protein